MGNELTLEELAELIAAPADQLHEWRSLGLIGRESAHTFGPEDAQRIRLIQSCDEGSASKRSHGPSGSRDSSPATST